MKKFYTAVLLATIIFALGACNKVEKDPLDYYPKVQTVSAVVQSDGSVLVTGQIADEGADVIEYSGFCMDTIPEPKMLSNQVISGSGSTFTATYDGFNITKKYYFRAWAANEYGYSYGNVIALDSIEAVPVVAPCNPPANTLNYGGGQPTQFYYDVSEPVEGFNQWEVSTSTGSGTYYFVFGSKPTTRIYTTTINSSPAPGEVHIYFYSGFISGTVSSGASFYVNQTSIDTWNMTMCSAPWQYNGSTLYMTTKFVCPL